MDSHSPFRCSTERDRGDPTTSWGRPRHVPTPLCHGGNIHRAFSTAGRKGEQHRHAMDTAVCQVEGRTDVACVVEMRSWNVQDRQLDARSPHVLPHACPTVQNPLDGGHCLASACLFWAWWTARRTIVSSLLRLLRRRCSHLPSVVPRRRRKIL